MKMLMSLCLLVSSLSSVSGFAVPLHRVNGTGRGFDGESFAELSAIEDMYKNAKTVCDSVGSDIPKRVSGISLEATPVFGSYGRIHVNASALFFCDNEN